LLDPGREVDMPGPDSTVTASRGWWSGEGVRWIIVTLLIPFAGFVWNEVQEREVARQKALEKVRADEQARVANARSESDIVIKLLPALASGDEASPTRGIALAVLLNLANRDALSLELLGSVQVAVDSAQQRLRDGKATEAERVALSKIAAAADTQRAAVGGEAPQPQPATPAQTFRVQVPRVYIQIFDEADRASARALQDWIANKQRWLAPGIENVVATAARANRKPPAGGATASVRYFNDEDRARADEVAGQLRATGAPSVVVQRSTLKAPAGQLEVWFPVRSG
jgi:hypothetical protein